MSKRFSGNIKLLTLANENYREVIHTNPQQQLVLMSLNSGEYISNETHNNISQFIRVELGEGIAIIGNEKIALEDDSTLVIPPGISHEIKNITSSGGQLKLYTVYSPPEHAPGTIHKRQSDADAAHAKHHHNKSGGTPSYFRTPSLY